MPHRYDSLSLSEREKIYFQIAAEPCKMDINLVQKVLHLSKSMSVCKY